MEYSFRNAKGRRPLKGDVPLRVSREDVMDVE
jgi:hypothetical protein